MQQLYTDLLQCPACLSIVSPVDLQNELNQALAQGAQIYEEGQQALATKEKEGGRLAYCHFAQAKATKTIMAISILCSTRREFKGLKLLVYREFQ